MHLYAVFLMVELEAVYLISYFHPQHVGWPACILLDLELSVGLPYHSADECKDNLVDVVSVMVRSPHHSFEVLLEVANVAYF